MPTDLTREPADWYKIEYDQINQYGRLLYQTIQTLAQMTFVINPALGATYYYVYFEKRSQIASTIGTGGFLLVAAAIAVLGIVYNSGAFAVYLNSHKCLEALLIRMREIDRLTKVMKLHKHIEKTAPSSYNAYWATAEHPPTKRFHSPGDFLSRAFLILLAFLWATILSISLAYGWQSPAVPLQSLPG
jgi:hypothetical protein